MQYLIRMGLIMSQISSTSQDFEGHLFERFENKRASPLRKKAENSFLQEILCRNACSGVLNILTIRHVPEEEVFDLAYR